MPTAAIGIDYGEKHCGIAWSPDGECCFPIGIYPPENVFNIIKEKIYEKSISLIVFGLPINFSHTDSHQIEIIKNFAKNFEVLGNVCFVNEWGSSQATDIPNKKGKPRIDDLAAMQILEYWYKQNEIR